MQRELLLLYIRRFENASGRKMRKHPAVGRGRDSEFIREYRKFGFTQ